MMMVLEKQRRGGRGRGRCSFLLIVIIVYRFSPNLRRFESINHRLHITVVVVIVDKHVSVFIPTARGRERRRRRRAAGWRRVDGRGVKSLMLPRLSRLCFFPQAPQFARPRLGRRQLVIHVKAVVAAQRYSLLRVIGVLKRLLLLWGILLRGTWLWLRGIRWLTTVIMRQGMVRGVRHILHPFRVHACHGPRVGKRSSGRFFRHRRHHVTAIATGQHGLILFQTQRAVGGWGSAVLLTFGQGSDGVGRGGEVGKSATSAAATDAAVAVVSTVFRVGDGRLFRAARRTLFALFP